MAQFSMEIMRLTGSVLRGNQQSVLKAKAKSAWVVDYVDATGKRRLKTFSKKKDADSFAITASAEVRDGTHVADRETVTVDVASKLWFARIKTAGLERTTVDDYQRHFRLHVVPFIGHLRLNTLTTARLRSYEDELRAAGRSPDMARRALRTLGTMLADAQERGLVVRNAAKEMRARRSGSDTRQEKRQKGRLKVGVDIPLREDLKALLSVAQGRMRALILTAAFCGLRASELRGLRWQDVNFIKSEIHVTQRADIHNVIGAPKSIAGERSIPAPPIVINALREWKLACPKRSTGKIDAHGQPVLVHDLVFPTSTGKPDGLNNILRRGLHPLWIAAGITIESSEQDDDGNPILLPKYTGLHCLRHWFASFCINRKEDGGLALPPKVVQERMGHSTIALTMDRYGHLFPRNEDNSELAAAANFVLN